MTGTLRAIFSVGICIASVYFYPFAVGDAAAYEVVDGNLVRVLADDHSPQINDLLVRLGIGDPDPSNDSTLFIVQSNSPTLFAFFAFFSIFAPAVLFFITSSVVESVAHVWFEQLLKMRSRGKLPPWPLHRSDRAPMLCIGEVHHKQKFAEHPYPKWLTMPEKGLYTGLAIFGAIGTGKTTSCMKPFCRQLLEWQSKDLEQRVAMLVLEVKGDFCYDVQSMLEEYGRMDDYMELSLGSLKSVLGEGEAWRALLQTLRSRIFLSLADDFSQKTASELLGQVNRMKASFSISENTGKASASMLTGRMGGGTASAGLSKSYQERREALFHQRDLALLGTCQAVAQIFDGATVRDATRVYLKPDYRPRDEPFWEWYRKELAPAEDAA